MKSKLPDRTIFEDILHNDGNYYFYNPITEIKAYDQQSLVEAFKLLEKLQKMVFI